jgi:hypothetical protein
MRDVFLFVSVIAGIAFLAVLAVSLMKNVRESMGRIREHSELFRWLMEEYGKQSYEMLAADGVVLGFDHMSDHDAETLRGLIDAAPRRVANDIREILRDYEAWKAAK